MDELAKPAIEAVRSGQIKFHPERWTKVYLEWMENIRPWCISRQLWWGHQIPVWYHADGRRHVGMEAPDGDGWERDPDVLVAQAGADHPHAGAVGEQQGGAGVPQAMRL